MQRPAAGLLRLAAVVAAALAAGSGCVVVNVGDPVSFSREAERENTSETKRDILLSVEPELSQESWKGYSNAVVRLRRNVQTTSCIETNVVLERITLTSQKRMAIGLFPGAASLLCKSEGPAGSVSHENRFLPTFEELDFGNDCATGIASWAYFASGLLSTSYTLLVSPFTRWTIPVVPFYGGQFSDEELAACGMAEPRGWWPDILQLSLAGIVKYPDVFIRREEISRKTLQGPSKTEVHNWTMHGFEAELRIPEVGFQQKKATSDRYPRDVVTFDLPTDPRTEDMVTISGKDELGFPWYDQQRRTYRALLTFRPTGHRYMTDLEKEAWGKLAGRTFEKNIRLEKGPSNLNAPAQVVEVVKEVHHYHETRVVEERKRGPVREFDVE